MMNVYKIADVVFGAELLYPQTENFMKDYLAPQGSEPDFVVSMSYDDILAEKELSPYDNPDYIYEYTAVYRKFIYKLMSEYDAFFFHCSSIAVNGQAVMFTAQSGTGKSTHRNLWLKNFGDKVRVINDDKPVIRRIDGQFYVYGTPWMGKEGFGENIRVPAKALCFLSRSEKNSIGPIETTAVIARALNQTVRPKEPQLMSNLLELLDGFISQVDTYDLRVNMDDEAAIVAYNGIFGEQK